MKRLKGNLKKVIDKLKKVVASKYFPYICIFLFAIFLIWPSIMGEYHLGDDEAFHLSSIKTIADYLPFSIFYKIFPDMSYNFGYGSGLFYPPLTHIVGGIIYGVISFAGFGLLATDTIIHFITFFASGITMYWLALKVFS